MSHTLLSNIKTYAPADIARYLPEFLFMGAVQDTISLPSICGSARTCKKTTTRSIPGPVLLNKVLENIKPLSKASKEWLFHRGVCSGNLGEIDYSKFTQQELLDLNIIPMDHLIAKHGMRKINGIIFPDIFNGEIVGFCIRNTSSDLEWVADAKFTFSSFGSFIYGRENIKDIECFITEGVFDAIAFRQRGYQAIGYGSASPSTLQLAWTFHHIKHPRICMDSDIYGRCGAYVLAKCLMQSEVYEMIDGKDPAEAILENNSTAIRSLTVDELHSLILEEAPRHQEKIAKLDVNNLHKFRKLKYN